MSSLPVRIFNNLTMQAVCADDGQQLAGSAGKDVILHVKLFNEGGQSVRGPLLGWSIACSWADTPEEVDFVNIDIVQLPTFSMSKQEMEPVEYQIQLLRDGQEVDSSVISISTFPNGLHEEAELEVSGTVQAGEACSFSLLLRDRNGVAMRAPKDLFKLVSAQASWNGSQTEALDGLDDPTDIIVPVPSNLPQGSRLLQLDAEVEPWDHKDRPFLNLPEDGAVKVSAEVWVDVRAGSAAAFILDAPQTCKELDLVEITATAVDANGAATSDVPEQLALTVHLGLLPERISAGMQQHSDDPSVYSCRLHADLPSGQHTLSMTATGGDDLDLPADSSILLRPSSRIMSINLQHVSGGQWTESKLELSPEEEVDFQATLQLAAGVPERNIDSAAVLQGLHIELKQEGREPQQLELKLTTTGSGLCFDCCATALRQAGAYILQATWEEQDPILAAELKRAAQATTSSEWQPPTSWQVSVTIKHEEAYRLVSFWCNPVTAAQLNWRRSAGPGMSLPRIGIRVVDRFENPIDLGLGTFLIAAEMEITAGDKAQGHVTPRLAAHEGAAEFEAVWHQDAQAFIMPEEASQLSTDVPIAPGVMKVKYKFESVDDLSSAALEGNSTFSFRSTAEVIMTF